MMSPGLEELVAKTRAAKSPLMFLYHGILEKPPLEVFHLGEPEPHNRTGPLPPEISTQGIRPSCRRRSTVRVDVCHLSASAERVSNSMTTSGVYRTLVSI